MTNIEDRIDRPRVIAMLIYPRVCAVDVSGPLEAFGVANFLTGKRLYRPVTVSVDGASVPVAGGFMEMAPTCSCADLPELIDMLIVAGGPGCYVAAEDETLLSWIRQLEPRCTRLGSVCTGAGVLVASGVADGERVATHWLHAMRMKGQGARVEVEADAIYVNSGRFWTSGGMLAGIDLALALIEQDHGRQLALDVARFMVLVLRRSSGQSQFSSQLMADATEDPRIRKVQRYIWENPQANLSVPELAKWGALSERSLARRFKEVTDTTLSRYIEDVRLATARQLLERSQQTLDSIAGLAGFGTAANMRRVFMRRLGVSPSTYRRSFGTDRPIWDEAIPMDDFVQMDLTGIINGKSVW